MITNKTEHIQCDGPFHKNFNTSIKITNIGQIFIEEKNHPRYISPGPRRQRIVVEEDKERDFPEVIMERDSPSKQ